MPRPTPKATKTFDIHLRVLTLVGVTVEASTWEDAVVAAKALKVGDCIDHVGDHLDSSIRVETVIDNSASNIEL